MSVEGMRQYQETKASLHREYIQELESANTIVRNAVLTYEAKREEAWNKYLEERGIR